MPDITMCQGGECPVKFNCYRHVAVPTAEWQSYFDGIPFDFNSNKCQEFDPMRQIDALNLIKLRLPIIRDNLNHHKNVIEDVVMLEHIVESNFLGGVRN